MPMLKNQQRSMIMFSRVLSFALGALVASHGASEGSIVGARQEVRDLLVSARGVAPSLCTLAADGLGSWGGRWQAPAEAIRSDIRTRVRQIRFQRLTQDESRALLDGLASADGCERHLAATLIGRFEDSTIVSSLVGRLTAGSATEREATLVSLGLLHAVGQLQPIARALRDETAGVRANAAWALGRLNSREAIAALVGVLGDRDETVRGAAVVSLGHLHAQDSIETLVRILRTDPSAEVRRVAAWALGELHDRSAAVALSQALASDKSDEVREMAAWALAESNARDAVDALVTAMKKDESAEVRETSAWALAELNARRVIDALADAVANDKEADVRGTAAWAIGHMHPGKAPAALLKGIRDADAEVRLKAAWALSEIGDPDATNAVAEALKTEPKERVQQAMVRALLRTGEDSQDVFRKLLESKDAETREMAVRALAGRRNFNPWPWPQPRPRPYP
jgi:HEAT repeat protein